MFIYYPRLHLTRIPELDRLLPFVNLRGSCPRTAEAFPPVAAPAVAGPHLTAAASKTSRKTLLRDATIALFKFFLFHA